MNTEITLMGKQYMLSPTFEALGRVEYELSTGITLLAERLSGGNITLRELVVVLKHCMVPELSERHIQDAVVATGIAYITQTIADMLVLVIGGHPEMTVAINRGELDVMIRKFADK